MRCDGMDTDNSFRSSDLAVMSRARCRCAMSVKVALVPWCTDAMWCDICPRQVSILWPSAYKAITIFKFGLLQVLVSRRRCCRRSAAELQGLLLELPLNFYTIFVSCVWSLFFGTCRDSNPCSHWCMSWWFLELKVFPLSYALTSTCL